MRKIIFWLIFVTVYCTGSIAAHRVKRKVLFTKNSKLFFRLNGKDNVLPWTTLIAHGWGFRVNWELPETLLRRHKFFKRDIHSELEGLNMIEGYSCILKYLCEFADRIKASNKCGVFCEIGNLVSRAKGADAEFFRGIFEKCGHYVNDCRYSFKDVTYSASGV